MWIKICGVTRPEDARVVQQAGADAIGLNFFSGSKRAVSVAVARQIADAVRDPDHELTVPDLVGVFVNAAADSVVEIVRQAGLTAVQFHGDETTADIQQFHQILPEIPIIRAVRINQEQLVQVLSLLNSLREKVPLAAVLVDALVAGQFGGTGHVVDGEVFCALREQFQGTRLILAGGLSHQNVGEVSGRYQPWGVDTASGVESQPGIKDSWRVQEFVRRARAASAPPDATMTGEKRDRLDTAAVLGRSSGGIHDVG